MVVAVKSGQAPIAFAVDAALNQSIDPNAGAPLGTMMDMVNLRKVGEGRLQTREGFLSVALAPTQYLVRGFGHERSQTVVIDNLNLNTFDYASNTWRVADRAPQWTLDGLRPIAEDAYAVRRFPSSCSAGGVTLHVWLHEDSVLALDPKRDGVYAMVVDEYTGNVVRGPEKISPSTHTPGTDANCPMLVRCASDGVNAWVVYQYYDSGAATNRIFAWCVSASFLRSQTSWSAPTQLCADLAQSLPSFDISPANGVLYLAYNRKSPAPANFLRLSKVDTSPSVSSSVDIITGVTRTMSVAADSAGVWIAYVDIAEERDVRLSHCNKTTLALDQDITAFRVQQTFVASKVTTTGIAQFGGGQAMVVASNDYFTAPHPISASTWQLAQWNGSALSMFGAPAYIADVLMASQPFYTGGTGNNEAYCWFHSATYDGTTLEANTDRAFFRTVLARLAPENVAFVFTNSQTIAPELAILAATTKVGTFSGLSKASVTLRMAPNKVTAMSTATPTSMKWDATIVASSQTLARRKYTPFTTTGITECSIGWACVSNSALTKRSAAHAPAHTADYTITSGGTHPYLWDGRQFTEVGFVSIPSLASKSTGASGGSVAAGDYLYAFVYEYTDGTGRRQWSAPRITSTVTVPGGHDTVTISATALYVTAKQDRDNALSVAGSTASMDTATQVVFYRTRAGPGSVFYRLGSGTNDPINGLTTFSDKASDAAISVNPILYTSLGELANECPPPAVHCVVFGKRFACIDAENRERIYFSKPFKENTGPEFSSALQTIVRGIGPLTALGVMDGTLYAFSATGVAIAAYGPGQDATGGGEWPEPQIVARNAGCSDARAISSTQDGLIFGEVTAQFGKLRGRIWLLPRGGGVPVEIGSKVRAYLGERVAGFTSSNVSIQDITSVVDWPERGRVMISIIYYGSSLTTAILEYDYINRGADGMGTWGLTTYSGPSMQSIGSGWIAQNVYWFCSADNNYKNVWRSSLSASVYLDTSAEPVASTSVAWSTTFHAFKLEGSAPRGKLNAIDVGVSLYHTGAFTMSILDANWATVRATTTFNYTYDGRTEPREHRHWEPPIRRDDTGEGITLKLSGDTGSSGAGPGVMPRSVTLDYVPARGYYSPRAAERA